MPFPARIPLPEPRHRREERSGCSRDGGASFYEMLTGVLPFVAQGLGELLLMHLKEEPRPVRERAPEAPAELEALVKQMLAKEPSKRPSAREVARAMDPAVPTTSVSLPAGPSGPAMPSGPLTPPPLPGVAAVPMAPVVPVLPSASPMPPVPLGAGSVSAPAVPLAAVSSGSGRAGAFVHRGSRATTVENWVYVDHPQANNDPSAQLLITANWNPGGTGGTYNNHHTGVWLTQQGRWSIYNEDRLVLSPTAAFNVLVTKAGFIHRASPGNIVNNWSLLDHPACNGRSDAVVLVTASWNPGGIGGTYNNHALGVWYTNGRWAVFNQDRAPMPPTAAWNVLCPEGAFVHRVSPQNLCGGNGTWLEHPAARGNPDAVILVTPNWNPGGQGGLYHGSALGVYYCGDRWAIFNQDLAPMPIGAAFNVWIA